MLNPRSVLVLVCLGVPVAGPVSSATAVPTELDAPGVFPTNPQLIGPDVAYSARTASGGYEVRTAGPGGARVLRDRPPAPEDDNEAIGWVRSLGFMASTGVLVTIEGDSYSIKGAESVSREARYFGPLAGPLRGFTGCGFVDVPPDGNRLAISRCGDGGTTRVEVLDVVAGGTTLRVIENARALALRGDLVAYRQGEEIVVRNVVNDVELYRFAAPPVAAASLQADGKVALSAPIAGSSGCSSHAWYSPAEPTPHALPGACVVAGSARLAGDRVLYSVRDSSGAPARLVLSDLAGQARVLADGTTYGADFDGARVVFSCDVGPTSVLVQDDLAEPLDPNICATLAERRAARVCHPDGQPSADDNPLPCPVFVATSRVRVDSRRRALVRVNCASGCRGTLRVRRRVGRSWRWISDPINLNVREFGARRYRLQLTSRPPRGREWTAQVVATSKNRVSGTTTFRRNVRLIRG